MTRAAIYARVSTTGDRQDIGLQTEEIRGVCSHRGWTVAGIYTDELSGSTTSRPGLDAMLDDARSGRLDVVVVWKLDRLGRSLQHLLGILDDLRSWGVDFVSVRDSGIDTASASGRLLLQLLGSFAEFERAMIRERVQAGVNRAKAKGIHCGRPRVEMDLRPALAMLREGHGLKAISTSLGVSRATLRRRLIEAGAWPLKGSTTPSARTGP